MMNIWNIGSKESLGGKSRDSIYAKLRLKGLAIFLRLLGEDDFESSCPETKFHTITS